MIHTEKHKDQPKHPEKMSVDSKQMQIEHSKEIPDNKIKVDSDQRLESLGFILRLL